MYKFKDYWQRGTVLTHNRLFPARRRISTLMIYATDLCDSRCKHCLIWKKRPVKYLPKDKILELMEAPNVTRHTKVGLEGGEFLLHPESREIISWFHEHHPNFDLLSNCLKPDQLIEVVRRTPPIRLYISLDGTAETYRYMRGKDGYERVLKVIENLKSVLPISVMFCLSPYNSMEDLAHVAELCRFHEVDLRVGVYSNIKFFDTEDAAYQDKVSEPVPEVLKAFQENYDYLLLYNEWQAGRLKLPCKSIYDSVVILPNGDVPICMHLDTKLGNVFEQSLPEIIASSENRKVLKDHHDNCNGCWVNFHRKYDLILYRQMEKWFPKGVVSKLFGYYQWSETPGRKYKQVIADLEKSQQHKSNKAGVDAGSAV